ncbi:hypothetical protein An04g09950 [Aspergillus niger]|uniref:Uncharacterized protein n=2 Tax=Aspergillus niger TaxID=5061 RepID=A2QKA8_ASPNC|nr:hypothetical protein An04g09950 [Aspergillus niger]CAK39054.1 hypothetical protein An04g09950 [Aspergillus niger]
MRDRENAIHFVISLTCITNTLRGIDHSAVQAKIAQIVNSAFVILYAQARGEAPGYVPSCSRHAGGHLKLPSEIEERGQLRGNATSFTKERAAQNRALVHFREGLKHCARANIQHLQGGHLEYGDWPVLFTNKHHWRIAHPGRAPRLSGAAPILPPLVPESEGADRFGWANLREKYTLQGCNKGSTAGIHIRVQDGSLHLSEDGSGALQLSAGASPPLSLFRV